MPALLVQQDFLRPGTYHGHPVTREDLEEAARNTNSLISRGYSIPVFRKHKDPGAEDGGPVQRTTADDQIDAIANVGWAQGFGVKPDGAAWHRLQICDSDAVKGINNGSIRMTSPEICYNYRDADGNLIGKVFRHVALTPKPRNPIQGPFVPMSEPTNKLRCVQFSLNDRDDDDESEGEGDGAEGSAKGAAPSRPVSSGISGAGEDVDTMQNPRVNRDTIQIAKQIMSDLEAAGIAAPRGTDPLKNPLAFLQQLSAALRQKALTEAEAEAKKDSGDGSGLQLQEDPTMAQYSEPVSPDKLDVAQFAEHQDPTIRALAKRVQMAEAAKIAEVLSSRRGKLSAAIDGSRLPPWAKKRLADRVGVVQFGERGDDVPSMRVTEVLALCQELLGNRAVQFSESDLDEMTHPDGDAYFETGDATMSGDQINELANFMVGASFDGGRDENLAESVFDLSNGGTATKAPPRMVRR